MQNPCVALAVALLAGWGAFSVAPTFAAESDSVPLVEEVVAAWKAREQAVRSVRFEWSGTMTYVMSGDSLDRNGSPDVRKVFRGDEAWSLVLDAQQLRLHVKGKRFQAMLDHHEEWVDQELTHVVATDSTVLHFLDAKQLDPLMAPSSGSILSSESELNGSRNFEVDPIVMHFRAMNTKLSNIQGRLSATNRTGVVEGHRCWIFWEDGQCPTEYWVDPQKAYAIVRMRQFPSFKPGLCLLDTQVSFKADDTVQWVPASWKGTLLNNETGEVRQSCEYTVTSYEINPPIDASVFDYQFPTGTRVVDFRQSPRVQYIVREGGQKRLIAPAESGADYQTLLNTESGKAMATPPESGLNH